MDLDSKRKVSSEQITGLLEFLKEHQTLAKGMARGRTGNINALKLWTLCAKRLNSCTKGAVKDGKGWSKYWCDWKYRVRRKAFEIKAAKDSNRLPLDGISPLTPIEKDILSIIGQSDVDGVVIKWDPLEEEDTFPEPDSESNCEDIAFCDNSVPERRLTRSRKRSYPSRDVPDFINVEDTEPNSPRVKKPAINARNLQDSDNEAEAAQFLRLEKQKLDNSKSIKDSLNRIANDITRLTDIMSSIKDILSNKINIQI